MDRIKHDRPRWSSSALPSLTIGAAAGLLGLAPWLTSGRRLPLQNLWRTETLPDDMPVALLPLNQYYLAALVALLAIGGLIAGLALRHVSSAARPLVGLGLLAVHGGAIAQSYATVSRGLVDDLRATIYLVGLAATLAVGLALAQLVLWLVAHPGRALAALGLGLVATPVGGWLTAWLVFVSGPGATPDAAVRLVPWVPAVIVGLTLGWLGWGSRGRAVVWVIDLCLLWLVPASETALQAVVGSRAVLSQPDEILPALSQVLVAALGPAGFGPVSLGVALAVALLVLAVRWAHGRPGAETPNHSDRAMNPIP